MTILVVDDSATMRMLLRRELRLAGWDDVKEATDGASALEIISSSPVSLVLCDWHMPAMTGLELLEKMKGQSSDTMFGFVTSEASDSRRVHALNAGARFVISKPVDHEDLGRHIRLALGMCAEDGPGADATEKRTLQNVLSRLFQRSVSVSPATPPRRELARSVVEYRSDGAGSTVARAVVEIPLAAAFGCALARIPTGEAQKWAEAQVLIGSVESNFQEVANVLAGMVSPATGHYVLQGIDYVGSGGVVDREKERNGWQHCIRVEIAGYPAGRMGILC